MSQRYPFQTMTLGFGLSSLSPYCDPDTLYLHHGQYYAQKVRELNHLVSKHRFTNLSLEELLTQDINMPAVQLARLKGAAGAVYNHELYFDGIQSAAPEQADRRSDRGLRLHERLQAAAAGGRRQPARGRMGVAGGGAERRPPHRHHG